MLRTLYFVFLIISLASCTNTQKGASVGAIVGVGAGAAIGGGTGAVIGGAVGATSGAIIGSTIDDDAREHLNKTSPDTLQKIDEQKPLTPQDIIHMKKAGLSDEQIINQIKITNSHFSLSPQEMIDLKNQGVSQSVIDAMSHS